MGCDDWVKGERTFSCDDVVTLSGLSGRISKWSCPRIFN